MYACIYVTIIVKEKKLYIWQGKGNMKELEWEVGIEKYVNTVLIKFSNKNLIKNYVLASSISKLAKIKAYYLKMQYQLKM